MQKARYEGKPMQFPVQFTAIPKVYGSFPDVED